MGKKNKKVDKKGKGKEKTELKAEKKATKRSKKELAEKGEDDIEKVIAQFREQDRRQVEVIEEKCGPPPPRCNASLVSLTERDELILFGGEYFTGNKMFVYNDLFIFNIRKQEWSKVSIPNMPPPRSAHQAVVVPQQGGQMWVFAGEFSSHSQAQFYHYKDLWVLHLRERRWEQVKAPGGPSARSGHRMIAMKKQLFVFGGFHDNTRDYKYFNDVYSFDIETYTWTALNPIGNGPSPRSGCVFLPTDTGRAVIYGGYSKERLKKDVDKGTAHADMFILALEKKREGVSEGDHRWKWQSVKQSGNRPTPRSGMTGVLGPNNKAYLFGGVFDEEDEDEFLEGVFYNDLLMLDLEKCKWFSVELSKQPVGEKKKRRKKKEINGDGGEESETEEAIEDNDHEEDMEVTQLAVDALHLGAAGPACGGAQHHDDGVFKLTVAKPSGSDRCTQDAASDCGMEVDSLWPSKRMNTALTVKAGQLFLYGGLVEDDKDRSLTLNDMYSLDVQRPMAWNVIQAEDLRLQEWHDSESEEEGEGKRNVAAGGKEESDSEDTDDSMDDITFDDAPAQREGEGIADYFNRSKDYWVSKAREIYEEDGETISERRAVRFAKEICEEACEK